MSFNFDTMVDVKETDQGQAVATNKPDLSTLQDVPESEYSSSRPSVISKVAREIFKLGPVDQIKTLVYVHQNVPPKEPAESMESYRRRVDQAIADREERIVKEGIGKVLETPMQIGIAAGLAFEAVPTILGVGAFSLLDSVVNLRKLTDEKFPNTAPEVKDVIELTDFLLKGGLVGGVVAGGKKTGLMPSNKELIGKLSDAFGFPKNTNISAEAVEKVRSSGNLTEAEKGDILDTLGVKPEHADASSSSGIPVNVPSLKVMELADKPYWEMAKYELLGAEKGEMQLDLFGQPLEMKPTKTTQEQLGYLKSLQTKKEISGQTIKALRDFIEVENLKTSQSPEIKKLTKFVETLEPGDKFLSEKQRTALSDIIKELPNPEVTPKRIVVEKFGEKAEILSDKILSKVSPELIPTVEIKQGHPLVAKIVDKVSDLMIKAEDKINKRNKKLDEMLTKAEKSRDPLLPADERLKRKLYPQNKEIFQALGGQRVELTKEEAGVFAYLRNFFAKAKNELALERSRKNYVTHIEQPLTEKILNKGFYEAVRDIFKDHKQSELPVDIMLELDNIIGSEKFFKYALERKGGIEPTTNLRQIINNYSRLYETKKVLDVVLPEGQAVTRNLLQGKSAVWMKRYLQNLKGRGLDSNFKNGPMGWLAKVADGIVDLGYLKLLGLNWKSALKNVVAGEVNSWIYQDFPTYMKGKERFFSNPKRAYDLATEYGALEGTYSDFAQKGIGSLKKYQDVMMVGQKAGEIEVRSSIFASMLSEKEWKTGKLEPGRFNEIKDVIAKTQGVFSKWDSPLLLQTWYGRMFFQMNRWRITNALLLKNTVADAIPDIKAGKFNTQNSARLGKMLTAYGVGMYTSYQLGMAGYKTAADVARNMAQTVDGIFSLFTEGQLIKMFTDNPTLSVLKEFSNTMQNTAAYIKVPGARKTKAKGIEDTYIAPVENTKDVIGAVEENM